MDLTQRLANLKEYLPWIIDGHAGGLKGLELLAEMVEKFGSDSVAPASFMEEVEETLKSLPEFGILKYVYRLGPELLREKWFVYRKEG